MRLSDLNPRFYGAGGAGVKCATTGEPAPERHGLGLLFDCPCGCGELCGVQFKNPLDGGPVADPKSPAWQREGDTFETLTLTPSILRTPQVSCGWHGWIRNGEVTSTG